MQPAVSIITLGVEDIDAMKTFYRDVFGWTPIRDEGIVFFHLNGLYLALYPARELAEDAMVEYAGHGFKKFTLALLCPDRATVDATFDGLRARSAHIQKEPQEVFWGGYSGYVQDPEHNLWEIAHNPFLTIDSQARILES